MVADFRKDLTDRIIAALEAGTAPWQKPWDGNVVQGMMPFNPVSGVQYRGGNQLAMMLSPYQDPRWCTYKQAAAQGWQVRKGERSTLIEFWKWDDEVERLNEETQAIEKIRVRLERPIVRYANVFNAQQIDNVPELDRSKDGYDWEPAEMAERILAKADVPFFYDQKDRAFYHPAVDQIHMPPREAFPTPTKFYATALHELGHATGHAKRIGRDLSGSFGSADYAKEELRAELASFFLAARLGIEFDLGNHASYVKSWIEVLRDDKNEIFKASRDAEAITDYVMDYVRDKPLEHDATQAPPADAPVKPVLRPSVPAPAVSAIGAKTFITVPYAEKEEAKRLGAKWDKAQKSWFVPPGSDMATFGKWTAAPAQTSQNEFEADLTRALEDAGLVLDGPPKMDGRWHNTRVTTSRKTKALKGAYKAQVIDGVADGFIKNHDTDFNQAWFPKNLNRSPEDEAEYHRKWELNRVAREAEAQQEFEAAASRCASKWRRLPTADSHPYLVRKGVAAFGLKVDGDRLVTPAQDAEGKIWSLQYIPADPESPKLFEKGGQKTGHFHILGDLTGEGAVLFAEGYATAASLHMATHLPVVEVFDSGNLAAVMETLATKLKGRPKLICGDDDILDEARIAQTILKLVTLEKNAGLQISEVYEADIQINAGAVPMFGNPECFLTLETEELVPGVTRVKGKVVNDVTGHSTLIVVSNAGREKATAAANTFHADVVFPVFKDGPMGRSDFNDLFASEGAESVRAQLTPALHQALQQVSPEACAKAHLGDGVVLKEPQQNHRYVGPVVGKTVEHAVQDVGRSTAVKHELERLDRVPPIGASVRIVYEGEKATVRGLDRDSAAHNR